MAAGGRTLKYAIGVDVGGTKIAAGLIDDGGAVLSHQIVPTPRGGEGQVVAAVTRAAAKVAEDNGLNLADQSIAGIGIGVPGLVDSRSDVIGEFANLPELTNSSIRRLVADATGKTTLIDNDANVAAMGEHWVGAATESHNTVMLTVGTGIGGGVVIQDHLLRGSFGAAGELGHMVIDMEGPLCTCGNRGCLESLAAGPALLHRAKRYISEPAIRSDEMASVLLKMCSSDPSKLTGPMITQAALMGDALSVRVYAETGEALGVGISNLINIFNPEMVVIGGGVTEAAGELLLGPARTEAAARAMTASLLHTKIVHASLGNKAGVIGAAALVFETV